MADSIRERIGVVVVLVWMGVHCLLAGCAKYTDFDAFVVTPRQSHSLKPYVIEPPDVITIIAPNATEIHNTSQRLRPDGYITLVLIGDMLASGKTPTLLAMEIQEKVYDYYEDVQVQVQVTRFNSKFYYMAGETRAGPVEYTGNDTVFDAVLRAGLLRSSWPKKGLLIRPNEDGELIRRLSIDFKAMIETGDLSRNAVLEEGDIVFVPINPLAMAGVMLQNLLAPVQPAISAIASPARAASAASLPIGGGDRIGGVGGRRF